MWTLLKEKQFVLMTETLGSTGNLCITKWFDCKELLTTCMSWVGNKSYRYIPLKWMVLFMHADWLVRKCEGEVSCPLEHSAQTRQPYLEGFNFNLGLKVNHGFNFSCIWTCLKAKVLLGFIAIWLRTKRKQKKKGIIPLQGQ